MLQASLEAGPGELEGHPGHHYELGRDGTDQSVGVDSHASFDDGNGGAVLSEDEYTGPPGEFQAARPTAGGAPRRASLSRSVSVSPSLSLCLCLSVSLCLSLSLCQPQPPGRRRVIAAAAAGMFLSDEDTEDDSFSNGGRTPAARGRSVSPPPPSPAACPRARAG
jgi:hypothetical protein